MHHATMAYGDRAVTSEFTVRLSPGQDTAADVRWTVWLDVRLPHGWRTVTPETSDHI
jgi:hypothetical protein